MELTLWLWGIGGEKVCAPERVRVLENCHFSRLKWPFFKTFSCADFDVVVVKKRFLGHQKKFQKVHKIPPPSAQIQQNSSELIHLW